MMRLIEVVADAGHSDTLLGILDHFGAIDYWWGADNEDGRRSLRMLVSDDVRQKMLDALQGALGSAENARIIVLPVEAVLPRPRAEADEQGKDRVAATREELYNAIAQGARLDQTYVWLVVLSTLAAAIGLIEDNVAVVIGAMVIAPLLGPIIAFAFATSLGDRELMWDSIRTASTGLLVAFGLSLLIGLLWPVNLDSREIMSRTDVGFDGVALALASGAAAVLSLTTRLSSTLVGVMVAVALLPPTAVLGMLVGSGQWPLAAGSVLLLAVNLVCVLLSAKLMFLLRGVKPRTWYERAKAKQSVALYLLLWAVLLGVLMIAILWRHGV